MASWTGSAAAISDTLAAFAAVDDDDLGRCDVKLISWNVCGRKAKQPAQASALLDRAPHVVALQEVTRSTLPLWKLTLEAASFSVLDSGDCAGDRKNFNVIALRKGIGSCEDARWTWQGEYPERMLSALLQTNAHGTIELHNVHIVPGSSRGFAKVEQLRTVYEYLARPCATHRVVCGDFNKPQAESPSGEMTTFADRDRNAFDAWDEAERRVLLGLAEHDLPDLFRRLHRRPRLLERPLP